jgi:hypothetical protein
LGSTALLSQLASIAFIPAQVTARASRTSLRAQGDRQTEAEAFVLPKPDLGLLNRNAKIGQTFDQDKKGNMWAVEEPARPSESDESLPAGIFIPGAILLTIGENK